MVVPVLIVSCQVSLKRKRGPQTSQRRTAPDAKAKADGLPAARDVALAKWVNHVRDLTGRMILSSVQGDFAASNALAVAISGRPGLALAINRRKSR